MRSFFFREYLFVLTAVWSLVILWLRGHAFVLGTDISGYRWQDYFFNAWMIHLQESQLYDPFRNPLHGYVLSTLGNAVDSYIHAAILISSFSIACGVISLGWAIRSIVGRGAGAVSMLVLAHSSLVYQASQWGNLYPMLAGLMALHIGIAISLFHQKRSRSLLWFLFFPSAVLLWAVDPRGVPIAVFSCALFFLYLYENNRFSLRNVIFFGCCIGIVGFFGMELEDGFGMAEGKHLASNSYIDEQRVVIYRWLTITNNPMMAQLCSQIDRSIILTPSLIGTECGIEMIKENILIQLPNEHVLSSKILFMGWFLAMIPLQKRKKNYASWLILICFFGYLTIHVITMPIVQRYMHIFIMPMLSFSILGWMRFVPKHLFLRSLLVVGTSIYLFWFSPMTSLSSTIDNEQYNAVALDIQQVLPPDSNYLDCSGYGVNLHLLPNNTIPYTPPPPLFKHILADSMNMFCSNWIRRPYPNAYIGLVKNIGGTPQDQQIRKELFSLVERKHGWNLVHMRNGYYLYQYQK